MKAQEPEIHRPYSARDKGRTLHPSAAPRGHIAIGQSQAGFQALNLHHSFPYQPAKGGMRLLSDSRVGTLVIVGPFHFSRGFMLWNDRFNLDVASLWRCEYYLS
ncbi:MAG TPA: hypothetical protein VFO40_21880 [Chthoniobacterales bacterium]|nr:hypothetical protein [Chthoniobacterales bacterium]